MPFFLMGPPPEGPGPNLGDLLLLGTMMFFIFWLLLFRPENKRKRERESMLKNLKKGDQVITQGGIIGKVVQLKENNRVILKIDETSNTKATFLRAAILEVIPAEKLTEKTDKNKVDKNNKGKK